MSLQANYTSIVTADSLDLQPGGNSNLVKGKWNGRIVVVKRLAVGVSEEALEDHARRWNPLTHPNISSTFIGARNSDPLFIMASTVTPVFRVLSTSSLDPFL